MKPENSGSTGREKPASRPAPAGRGQDKAMTLSLEAARFGSAVVLHCQGRGIFRSEARALAGLISEVLPAAQHLVVDLAGVITLDSDALGELVLTHMWADAAGYSLKFASASGPVRQLFESTNLVSVFDLYESVPEALAGLRHEEVQSA